VKYPRIGTRRNIMKEKREYIETPSKLTTPDKVKTSIGEFEFFDGMPSEETTKAIYDNLDRTRAVQVFLS
jgi:hypothetical protein